MEVGKGRNWRTGFLYLLRKQLGGQHGGENQLAKGFKQSNFVFEKNGHTNCFQ